MPSPIPKIDNEYFCIAHRDETILTTVVSSHINSPKRYSLIFGFSEVTQANDGKNLNINDEHQITRIRATTLDINLKNTLNRIGGCEYLILVGLNENQKSYLSFLDGYNIIDVNSLEDVDFFLQPISNKENIPCTTEQLLLGLQIASKEEKAIKIDENAKDIEIEKKNKGGLILVENDNSFETVVATNYAISIDADIEFIEPYDFHEKKFLELIELWREETKTKLEEKSYLKLQSLIYNKIENVEFKNYDFVTFFTIGAPYSLIIENIIPCTYVGLKLNADFFIFNNIYFQDNYNIDSAIVFSPRFFSREETDFVINKLEENNYHVNTLIKEKASSINLDYYVKELPFNILHLCSHGEQTEGSLIEEKYVDQFGQEHIFEYFFSLSLAPQSGKVNAKGEPLIKVTTKIFPRKLNGTPFKTKEFKKQNYPSSIFPKMFKEVPIKENKISSKRVTLENSHEITCYKFSHMGMFAHLAAGRHSPLIFNNTCWSAYDIKNHFIAIRTRAYIGTLWNINNSTACKTAESFYETLFDKTLLESLQDSLIHSKGTEDENIYVFYGLHFSKFNNGKSIENAKENIARGLLESIHSWQYNFSRTEDSSIKDNIQDLMKWNRTKLIKYYFKELLTIIKR
ncbi:hypothetical protein [uncultured Marixanthomonas sp.]|uniref:hypothetical protein n=1 Tax=uncultured Marixanthomonas sp. TaxID=757245 RepID=UPI0030D7358B|tara:strand:+ start:260890 stop:262776 length:1887 start_codon:yes stop_codon:yes gene_type:complete